MTALIAFVIANSGPILAAVYACALVGSKAADHTLVYKIAKFVLSGSSGVTTVDHPEDSKG